MAVMVIGAQTDELVEVGPATIAPVDDVVGLDVPRPDTTRVAAAPGSYTPLTLPTSDLV